MADRRRHELHSGVYHAHGLEPGTTYHYRVVGKNAYGTTVGDDKTFTTSSSPEPRGGISCTSSSFCVAVETYSVGSHSWTLGEQWVSSIWEPLSTYSPEMTEHSELAGVSCSSTTVCMGAGTYSAGAYSWTLGEEWASKGWGHLSTYSPPEAEHSESSVLTR
jgi:hypothetical protein